MDTLARLRRTDLSQQDRAMVLGAGIALAASAAVAAAYVTLRMWRGAHHSAKSAASSAPSRATVSSASSATSTGVTAKREILSTFEAQLVSQLVEASATGNGFEDVGGLEEQIKLVEQSVILPLSHPHLFSGRGGATGPPTGVLLYGPPGTGKTLLAKAIARTAQASFLSISAADGS